VRWGGVAGRCSMLALPTGGSNFHYAVLANSGRLARSRQIRGGGRLVGILCWHCMGSPRCIFKVTVPPQFAVAGLPWKQV